MSTEMPVREVMDREYVGVNESDPLVGTVELLLEEDADTAVVLRGSEPVGVVTERDVLALVVADVDISSATVADAMTESVPTVGPEETLAAATNQMSAGGARRLVVTDGGEPLGVLNEHDLLAARVYEPTPEEEPIQQPAGAAAETPVEAERGGDAFGEQGICEECGTLTRELAAFNGQLLCVDCREV